MTERSIIFSLARFFETSSPFPWRRQKREPGPMREYPEFIPGLYGGGAAVFIGVRLRVSPVSSLPHERSRYRRSDCCLPAVYSVTARVSSLVPDECARRRVRKGNAVIILSSRHPGAECSVALFIPHHHLFVISSRFTCFLSSPLLSSCPCGGYLCRPGTRGSSSPLQSDYQNVSLCPRSRCLAPLRLVNRCLAAPCLF